MMLKKKISNQLGSLAVILIFISLFVSTFTIYLIYKKTNSSKKEELSSSQQILTDDVPATVKSDLTNLPLGDNKYTTTGPKKGYIYSCNKVGGGGGAFKDGDWIDSKNGTWNKEDKNVYVDGSVTWSNAQFDAQIKGNTRELSGNGLPTNHGTGVFPVARTDDAFNYDRNPNSIQAQKILQSIPLNPTLLKTPRCLNMGAVGYSLNGVAIFNALDGEGRDAAAHEILDKCGGHPERSGQYHYHDYSECISEKSSDPKLIGYMLDGFGLYKYPANPSNSDLDECHGITGKVFWNGSTQEQYHYVVTDEYPYTIGCFRGDY